jgi:hypothetical protein
MPPQSPLRVIKRWRRYERRGDWKYLLPITRGIYVLYREEPSAIRHRHKRKIFRVVYIGVAGIAKDPRRGIGGRLREHDKSRPRHEWTHYSFFEVHNNVSREAWQ